MLIKMTTVVSIRSVDPDEYDILVDRSTPFGNPFSHLRTECTSAPTIRYPGMKQSGYTPDGYGSRNRRNW